MRPSTRICDLSHLGLTDIVAKGSALLAYFHRSSHIGTHELLVYGDARDYLQVGFHTLEQYILFFKFPLSTRRHGFKRVLKCKHV